MYPYNPASEKNFNKTPIFAGVLPLSIEQLFLSAEVLLSRIPMVHERIRVSENHYSRISYAVKGFVVDFEQTLEGWQKFFPTAFLGSNNAYSYNR